MKRDMLGPWKKSRIWYEELSDVDLMNRVRADDREAFCALVRRHQQALLNFFARMGADTDKEDLAQDTFVRLYKSRATYEPRARFTTFLYRLARNVWIDDLRKRIRKEEVFVHTAEEWEAPDAVCHAAVCDARMDVQSALDSLSDKLRMVMILRVYQGLEYDEIAEALTIPPGTVKSRINLAMSRLKEYFNAGKTVL
ncbi:MAG: sigma-70 family RNA polymerase sigma factor [Spartobacteria bacterium]|nr:sigma-70 family RNA polymerase sigma factor [Spartobacteria bacterium]